jgi:hypothetical protein
MVAKKTNPFLVGLLLVLLAFGFWPFRKCSPASWSRRHMSGTDQSATIKKLLNQERTAHMTKNADLLVSSFSPDLTTIADGAIDKPTKQMSMDRFKKYFSNSEFIKWDDVSPPVISFSDDSTMAYVVVDKLVILQNLATKKMEQTHFAWVSIFKKHGEEWMLDCIASTDKQS